MGCFQCIRWFRRGEVNCLTRWSLFLLIEYLCRSSQPMHWCSYYRFQALDFDFSQQEWLKLQLSPLESRGVYYSYLLWQGFLKLNCPLARREMFNPRWIHSEICTLRASSWKSLTWNDLKIRDGRVRNKLIWKYICGLIYLYCFLRLSTAGVERTCPQKNTFWTD